MTMPEPQTARVRQYRLDPAFIRMDLTQEEVHRRVKNGPPEDAAIADAGYDDRTGEYYLTLRHESFDPVAVGEEIPVETVTFEEIDPNPPGPIVNSSNST